MNSRLIGFLALMLISAAPAFPQPQTVIPIPGQQDQAKIEPSTREPHVAMSTAYLRNIGVFARLLQEQARVGSLMDAKSARAAVAEIKRSLDQMEEHHREHLKLLSGAQTTATTTREMDMNRSAIKNAVGALENDVLADPLDSKLIAADCARLLMQLEKMPEISLPKKP